jgi:hypothetical protein
MESLLYVVHKLRRRVVRATTFYIVAPNIFGPSEWKLLHVTLQTPRIFDVFTKSLENGHSPDYCYYYYYHQHHPWVCYNT